MISGMSIVLYTCSFLSLFALVNSKEALMVDIRDSSNTEGMRDESLSTLNLFMIVRWRCQKLQFLSLNKHLEHAGGSGTPH